MPALPLDSPSEPAHLRALILLALHEQFPLPLTEATLNRQVGLFYAGDVKAWLRDIGFLKTANYLKENEEVAFGRTVRAYLLTDDGVRLVEGYTKDPAVIFLARK